MGAARFRNNSKIGSCEAYPRKRLRIRLRTQLDRSTRYRCPRLWLPNLLEPIERAVGSWKCGPRSAARAAGGSAKKHKPKRTTAAARSFMMLKIVPSRLQG